MREREIKKEMFYLSLLPSLIVTMENNITIKIVDRTGVSENLEIPPDIGLNLMEACKAHELPVEGTCGGMALCASCHVYIESDHVSLERNYEEQAMFDEIDDVKKNSRLGCQIPITPQLDGLIIQLAPDSSEINF